jgi:hypothetical protein
MKKLTIILILLSTVYALGQSQMYIWHGNSIADTVNITNDLKITFTTANNPPTAPSTPSPTTGATGQSTSLTLSWSCSDPDGDALTYDVYFGTNSNPTTAISTNQSSNNISRSGLAANTVYYWKIIAKDNKGASTTGSVWDFSTAPTATASISGSVKDNSNQVITGVKIYTSPTTTTVYSDVSGNYAITGVTAGSYTVYAEKTGYTNYSVSIYVAQGQAYVHNIVMTPIGATGTQ